MRTILSIGRNNYLNQLPVAQGLFTTNHRKTGMQVQILADICASSLEY